MKLKINRATDLSSISVLPPQSRKLSSGAATGAEASIFGKIQAPASQQRSHPSQQSFSQGVSSQHGGLFSQISQNSLDDIVTAEQRFSSQERETSVKRNSCLPPISYPRDESQMQLSRSSSNIMRKWSNPEYKCQISEELEHRIGMMEASLSRVGLVLDSIQSDIMQVNKGTKEIALEMERLRQKMVVHDDLLQLMVPNYTSISTNSFAVPHAFYAYDLQLQLDNQNKGQEDIKSSFDGGLKALSVKISEKSFQKSSMAIPSPLSALPQKIETSILKLQKDLLKTFTTEIQALGSSLEASKRRRDTPVIHQSKAINDIETSQKMHSVKSMQRQSIVHHATVFPKIETGRWKSVKHEEVASNDRKTSCNLIGVSSFQLGRMCKSMVDSDEDINGAFLSLFKETGTGNSSIEEAREETERILRKARRRKRKHSNTIIID